MKINKNRIEERLVKASTFNDNREIGISRFSYSTKDKEIREYLDEIFTNLGMKVKVDSVGNIRARYEGSDLSLAPLWTGSHIDSVNNGGMYDGMVGVIGAIEACSVMQENYFKPRRSVEVVIFAEEEGSNFGTTMVGSKCLVGELNIDGLKSLADKDNISAYDRIKSFGLKPEKLEDDIIDKTDIYAMIELHIEQGGILEKNYKSIGVVKSVVGMKTLEITIEGISNHAGSTPMNMRRDPLVAAANLICEVEAIAAQRIFETTVATVGRLEVSPNMPNVIPKTIKLTIDIRDVKKEGINRTLEFIEDEIEEIKKRFGVDINKKMIGESRVYDFSSRIIDVIEKKTKEKDLPYMVMNSGAVHDSAMFVPYTDVGMIFVPSKNGISHSPLEYTSIEDISKGCQILLDTIKELVE